MLKKFTGKDLIDQLSKMYTSLSKLAFVNSKEFNSAVVAANLTWLLGSSRFIP